MIGKLFEEICKQQSIELNTEIATIDVDVYIDFVIGLEDLLGLKVDENALHTLTYISDLRNYFEAMGKERILLCAKVS